MNLETGEIRPAGCRRLTCPACVRIRAWRRSEAIAWARPNLAVTLTQCADADDADPWQTARRRINRWAEFYVKQGGARLERVVHVEANPRGTGHHAHLWLRGPLLDFDLSDRAARWAGLGWVHAERIRAVEGLGRYGLKGLSYGLKGTQGDPAEYLRLNGGRLTHQSRGFFHGRSVRDAETEALSARGESPWVLRPVSR
jgi:hypothetical protein